MNFALVGSGRMGQAIERVALARGHRRVVAFDSASVSTLGRPDRLEGVEVAFEFTRPSAAEDNVVALLEAGVAVVCGTTGWTPSERVDRALAASRAGLVLAPNFAVGVHAFARVVDHAARLFGKLGLHDPFVHEAHHRGKRDVPSGTALHLAAIVLAADPRLDTIRSGHPDGPLPAGALPVVGIRAGAEPGTHVVGFDGDEDRIALEHRARGRQGFALGAVLAAEWILGRRGRYGFEPVFDALLEGD